ncbi:hypothetical protein GMORB2_5765 [Geosmithia morbida]|uniref:Uncharacterized protein n=1 Tax=Geosmithia morbida TaxID=1094350 RepID=A0A9P4YZU0_9HYPO|nr:uncharacterized protein GMORB2_5765 [Geosmithia morbida]KAF4124049.1 hypothetical protein GMORB2_5765 [Geosmithia morbida]
MLAVEVRAGPTSSVTGTSEEEGATSTSSVALTVTAVGTPSNEVTFNSTVNFRQAGDDPARVWTAYSKGSQFWLSWSTSGPDVKLLAVSLVRIMDKDASGLETVRNVSFATPESGAIFTNMSSYGTLINLTSFGSADRKSRRASVADTAVAADDDAPIKYKDVVAVQLDWDGDGDGDGYTGRGSYVSGFFSVVADQERKDVKESLEKTIESYRNYETGMIPPPRAAVSSSGRPSATSTQSINPSVKSGGGGLSTGAIAGIAIGCVVGLAILIPPLIWFSVVRPRRKRGGVLVVVGGRGAGQHLPMLSAKGKISGDRVADEADSPGVYAPVQQQQQQKQKQEGSVATRLVNPAAGGGSSANASPSRDDVVDGRSSRALIHEPAPAAQTRTSVNPRQERAAYSHLVEDGMTEEQIRQLEKEERELDEEIERQRAHGDPR